VSESSQKVFYIWDVYIEFCGKWNNIFPEIC